MSDFNATCPESLVLDPYKRVYYATEMVLGVDDFWQEQTYLLNADRLHNRVLHGYGVACGLNVAVEDEDGSPQIRVAAGLAVSPKGEMIRVPQAQCARLNDWLDRHPEELTHLGGSPPQTLTLYLIACYRPCQTDRVPIPSGPCRTLEESSTPSRIADHFQLQLRTTPPAQIEEERIQQFGNLLRQLEISDAGEEFLTVKQMEELVRSLATGSPAEPAFPQIGSPPVELRRIHPDEAADLLRVAMRIWVREVRPTVIAGGKACAIGPPDEDCVLLARLTFDVEQLEGVWRVMGDAEDVQVEFEHSPFLLQTRLLQEWLLNPGTTTLSTGKATKTFATLSRTGPDTIRAWIHHPELLTFPEGAVTLEREGNPVWFHLNPLPGVNVIDLETDAGTLEDEGRMTVRFDTTAILTASSPPVSLLSLLDAADFGYLDREGTDLLAHLTVDLVRLNDLDDVEATSPNAQEVLTWTGSRWEPQIHGQVVHAVGDHSDVTTLEPLDGEVLIFSDDTGKWVNQSWAHGLGDHQDVAPDPPSDGDFLTFSNARGIWIPQSGAHELNDHEDVDAAAPVPGHVLTWSGSRWVHAAPPENVAERNLVRIVALSWMHSKQTDFMVTLDGQPQMGLIVGFGLETSDDEDKGVVQAADLNEHTIQVYLENPAAEKRLLTTMRVHVDRDTVNILPVTKIKTGNNDLITSARTTSASVVKGAAFVFRDDAFPQLFAAAHRVLIVVRGDFIRQGEVVPARAIDAEHLRGELPSGDRPAGRDVGIQGGTFESWTRMTPR